MLRELDGFNELIMSIDGVRPNSLEHIKELLNGDEPKTIIFRGWSSQDNKMYDYHEMDYWPTELKSNRKNVHFLASYII